MPRLDCRSSQVEDVSSGGSTRSVNKPNRTVGASFCPYSGYTLLQQYLFPFSCLDPRCRCPLFTQCTISTSRNTGMDLTVPGHSGRRSFASSPSMFGQECGPNSSHKWVLMHNKTTYPVLFACYHTTERRLPWLVERDECLNMVSQRNLFFLLL